MSKQIRIYLYTSWHFSFKTTFPNILDLGLILITLLDLYWPRPRNPFKTNFESGLQGYVYGLTTKTTIRKILNLFRNSRFKQIYVLQTNYSNILRISEHCCEKASLWSSNKCSCPLQNCNLAKKFKLILSCSHNSVVFSCEHLLCFREKLWFWTTVRFQSECRPLRLVVFRCNKRHLQ